MSDQNNVISANSTQTSDSATPLPALPAVPDTPVPAPTPTPTEPPVIADASPFAHPNYGREGEQPGYVIRSHSRLALEETQRPWTGWASMATIALGAFILATVSTAPAVPEWLASVLPAACVEAFDQTLLTAWEYRAVLLCVAVFIAMSGVELFAFKVHRRHFDFSAPREVGLPAWKRIGVRWLAVTACFVLAGLLYGILHEYRFFQIPYRGDYVVFHSFFPVAVVGVLVFSVPYFWMTERYARAGGPCDEFLILGRCLGRMIRGIFHREFRDDGRAALRNAHDKNLMLGLLVKFFYVPLMVMWAVGPSGWASWEQQSHILIQGWSTRAWDMPWDVALNLRAIHGTLLSLLIVAEVTSATVAYLASVRVLDTQVTTAEPTFFGWMVALGCYPPFNNAITGAYFWHNEPRDEMWHTDYFNEHPAAAITASIIGLTLMAIYAYCTFCFGLRFSNLTNRGVICHGPYKYVRHPAYICKNLSWWILVMQSFYDWPGTAVVYCVRAAGVSFVYYLRAVTEERHLMREPLYQEYCRKVPWRFIPGVW